MLQELIAAKLRAEAAARGEQIKQRAKEEMGAYEEQQRKFAEERARQEAEVSVG
jgi:hypothetical protein